MRKPFVLTHPHMPNDMKEFVFYTHEGRTIPPNEDQEAENCQLLGFATGEDFATAKANLLKENTWIEEVGFDPNRITGREVVADNHRQA